jgi:hypothetical protein
MDAAGDKRDQGVAEGPAVFWHEPGDIASRDLFYGPGGRQHEPHGPFTFTKEDLDGTNPKFVVRDRDGVKWKVKLGEEARPETVAARLVSAVGFYANEDYFLSDLQVEKMPRHLQRGQKMLAPDGSVRNVRLKREDLKKIDRWKWRDAPFAGTREWNGLRVMMALVNNWDLKDENNSVYKNGKAEQMYMVSDLGASFGTDNLCWPHSKAKGNLTSYRRSRFIRRTKLHHGRFLRAGPPPTPLLGPPDRLFRASVGAVGRPKNPSPRRPLDRRAVVPPVGRPDPRCFSCRRVLG